MKSVTFSPGSNCLLVSLSCGDRCSWRERGWVGGLLWPAWETYCQDWKGSFKMHNQMHKTIVPSEQVKDQSAARCKKWVISSVHVSRGKQRGPVFVCVPWLAQNIIWPKALQRSHLLGLYTCMCDRKRGKAAMRETEKERDAHFQSHNGCDCCILFELFIAFFLVLSLSLSFKYFLFLTWQLQSDFAAWLKSLWSVYKTNFCRFLLH